ncbi:MAG: DUF188 domain-containing protein [Spirochaetaceae bacterium]|nr:MAG: DUF188 domain-containing protein [Spirochaetaceae bacterium]
MRIWVDADSCPARVREIICKASRRRGVAAVFVANRRIRLPGGHQLLSVLVPAEEQSADTYLIAHAEAGDLAVTRDIPLAAELVKRGVLVLNDRGDVYSADNVRERLSIRDHMYELRASGIATPETGGFGKREIFAFANAFDRALTRLLKG